MGFEYRLTFRRRAEVDLDARLRQLPFFRGFDSERSLYSLSTKTLPGDEEWPDAVAAVEGDGIYFCAYRRSNSEVILGAVRRIAIEASKSGEVTLEEL